MQRVSYKAPTKSRPPSYSVNTNTNIPSLAGNASASITADVTAHITAFTGSRLLIRNVQCHRVKRIFFDAGDLGGQCSSLANRAFLQQYRQQTARF